VVHSVFSRMADGVAEPTVVCMDTHPTQYAVIGRWSMDHSRAADQDRELADVIVPMVKAQPGFVAGYWARDPESGRTHSVIVLDDERSADNFREMVQSRRQHEAEFGVVNDFLVVADVVASAYR
jgi:hypothetical protein